MAPKPATVLRRATLAKRKSSFPRPRGGNVTCRRMVSTLGTDELTLEAGLPDTDELNVDAGEPDTDGCGSYAQERSVETNWE